MLIRELLRLRVRVATDTASFDGDRIIREYITAEHIGKNYLGRLWLALNRIDSRSLITMDVNAPDNTGYIDVRVECDTVIFEPGEVVVAYTIGTTTNKEIYVQVPRSTYSKGTDDSEPVAFGCTVDKIPVIIGAPLPVRVRTAMATPNTRNIAIVVDVFRPVRPSNAVLVVAARQPLDAVRIHSLEADIMAAAADSRHMALRMMSVSETWEPPTGNKAVADGSVTGRVLMNMANPGALVPTSDPVSAETIDLNAAEGASLVATQYLVWLHSVAELIKYIELEGSEKLSALANRRGNEQTNDVP